MGIVRKVAALLVAAMLVTGLPTGDPATAQPASADESLCDTGAVEQFSDVADTDYGSAYVLCMRALGLSVGIGGGNYGPDQELNRGQMATFLVGLWRDVLENECPTGVVTPFTDVAAGSTHATDIDCLYGLEFTVGTSASTYGPWDPLRASEISRFLYRAYQKAGGGLCPETDGSSLNRAVACLTELRVLPNPVEGRSGQPVTRAQMGVYIVGLWHNLTGRGIPPPPPLLGAATIAQRRYVDLPWIRDGITASERSSAQLLETLERGSPDTAPFLMGAPWIVDGVTEDEETLIRALLVTARTNRAIANSVMTIPDRTGKLIGATLDSLRSLGRPRLQEIRTQAWFQDGLTGEEAALIVGLSSFEREDWVSDLLGSSGREDRFRSLITGGRVISETISLPLAGEVNLYAVSTEPRQDYQEDLLEYLRTGVRTIEDFLGRPWNNPNVIAVDFGLLEDNPYLAGFNTGNHIVITDPFNLKAITFHEIGHYLFHGLEPYWLTEGAAEFLSFYIVNGDATDREARLQAELSRLRSLPDNFYGSQELLGKAFLLQMHVSFGKEMVSASLGEVYDITSTGHQVTEKDVYETFLANVPLSRQAEFDRLYRGFRLPHTR